MRRNYTASLDKLAKTITIAISILFGSMISLQVSLIDQTGYAVPLVTAGTLLATYCVAYLIRTTGYQVTEDALIIRRPIGNIKISRDKIRTMELVDKNLLNGSVRTFGVGGLFGYFGKFLNHRVGNMTWYATRRDGAILIHTFEGKRIVITPDDLQGFIGEFKNQ